MGRPLFDHIQRTDMWEIKSKEPCQEGYLKSRELRCTNQVAMIKLEGATLRFTSLDDNSLKNLLRTKIY